MNLIAESRVRQGGTCLLRLISAFAAATLAATSSMASTTVDEQAQVQGYWSADPGGPWGVNAGNFSGHGTATVGHIKGMANEAFNGYYAALMQFELPVLPANAALESATLSFEAFPYDARSNGPVRWTAIANVSGSLDPADVGAGTDLGLLPLVSGTDVVQHADVTSLVRSYFNNVGPGTFAEFSFLHAADSGNPAYCGYLTCNDLVELGVDAGLPDQYFMHPTLSITYFLHADPPPLTSVPEPPTWLLTVSALGLLAWIRARQAVSQRRSERLF